MPGILLRIPHTTRQPRLGKRTDHLLNAVRSLPPYTFRQRCCARHVSSIDSRAATENVQWQRTKWRSPIQPSISARRILHPMPTRRFLTSLLAGLGVAAIYVIAGKIGLSLAFVNASASAVWPPTGIALAAFLIFGNRIWPAVLLGAFLVNFTTAGNAATSVAIAAGNTLEGLVGCWLIRRFAGGLHVFDQPSNVFKFAVLAGMVSTAVSATIGTTTLALGGLARWNEFGPIWLTWWM